MTEDNTFRVWIGCLACYNGGDLIGQWYDADEAGDVTSTSLHLRDSVPGVSDGDTYYVRGDVNPHEELWCFDIENAPKGHRSEMSPMEAQRLADVMESLGDNADAFAAWCANTGADFTEDSVSDFEDHFHGRHDSFRDYADEYAEQLLDEAKASLRIDDDHPLIRHFDWEAYADEMESDYFTEDAPGGGVYIFSN